MSAEEKTRISVGIYGSQYKLMSHASASYMKSIAAYVDEQMHKIADSNPRIDLARVAVLVAVNIADELYSQQIEMEKAQLMQKQDGATQEHFAQLQQEKDELLAKMQAERRVQEEKNQKMEMKMQDLKEREKKQFQHLQDLLQLQKESEQREEKIIQQLEQDNHRNQQQLTEIKTKYEQQIQSIEAEKKQREAELLRDVEKLSEEFDHYKQENENNLQMQIHVPEDNRLSDAYEKLQEEYKKLQSEYNEWIKLVENE